MLQDGGWGVAGAFTRAAGDADFSTLVRERRTEAENGLIQCKPGANFWIREGDMDMYRGRAILGGHGNGRVRVWGCIVPGLGLCKPRAVH